MLRARQQSDFRRIPTEPLPHSAALVDSRRLGYPFDTGATSPSHPFITATLESPLNRQPWILLLIGAFSLRLPRAVLRWTEDAWSYLAYDGEMARFEKGEYLTGLTDITGFGLGTSSTMP